MEGTIDFAQLLELHIINQINKIFAEGQTHVDNDALHKMHGMVKGQVFTVFGKSSHKVSEQGLGWLTNQIFKNLKVKMTDEAGKLEEMLVAELVIFNDYKLADLPYDDIKLLCGLFRKAPYGAELDEELGRRSAT